MRYSDYEQHQMDIASGEEMDRYAESKAKKLKVINFVTPRELAQLDARVLATLINHGDIEPIRFTVGGPMGLEADKLDDCCLCVSRLGDENEVRGFWHNDTFLVAHVICAALAKMDGSVLCPIDLRTQERSAMDLGWAHRIGKCDEFCLFCAESGA